MTIASQARHQSRAGVDALVVIRCHDLGRTFGTGSQAVVAVHGVTAVVLAGERIAITGSSGSGKSTLLHLLGGLDSPTVGTVEWPAAIHSGSGIGLVFQAPSLLPALSVRENVELPMLLNATPSDEARQRADHALDLLDLGRLADRLPQELSGGQAQRVVISRVLAAKPSVVLADEPTSKLDRDVADHVTSTLLDACSELGAALVVATHDRAVADRLDLEWPIHDGRLRTDSGAL